ncbi:MAG: hypothetical protein ABI355_00365, partial [Solirubrobacteraceae bacterium]
MAAPGRGAEDERWMVFAEEGIACRRLRPFVETLDDDFDDQAGGYIQFAQIADPYQRAVVSDLIGRSAQGVADNLLEARLSQHALDKLLAGGRPMPTKETGRAHIRESAWIDLHLGAVVAALQASFDCVAATAIGVMRVPVPIKRAQITQVANLTQAHFKPPTADMARAWQDWTTLVSHHQTAPPSGWWGWLAAMRHQRVHRARQNRVLIQHTRDPDQPQVLLFTEDPEALTASTAIFDVHLRRRPHLADMEDFVLAPDPAGLWLGESAGVTLGGIFEAANIFCEEAAEFLLAWWRYAHKWRSCFPPPTGKAWVAESSAGDAFDGFAPPV